MDEREREREGVEFENGVWGKSSEKGSYQKMVCAWPLENCRDE